MCDMEDNIVCHSLRSYHNMSPPDLWKWKWSNGVRKSEMSIIWFISFQNKFNGKLHRFSLIFCGNLPKWTNGYHIYSSVPQISILFLHYKHSAFLCISLHFITFYVLGKFDRAYLHYMDIIFCFGFDLFRTYLTLFYVKV